MLSGGGQKQYVCSVPGGCPIALLHPGVLSTLRMLYIPRSMFILFTRTKNVHAIQTRAARLPNDISLQLD